MTITEIPRLLVDDYQVSPETRYENEQRRLVAEAKRSVEPCWLCGRPLTEKAVEGGWWIEVGDYGSTLIATDADSDVQDSLGCFPLGSECSKKIPLSHRFRMAGAG